MATERDTADGTQYFVDNPEATSRPLDIEVVVPGAAFVLRTDRGVFSRGRLDTGTALLLRHDHPLPERGTLLDLGCGAGAIALTMAQRSPGSTVWAIDVNSRARELCTENAAHASLTNVIVSAPEDVPADLRFDAVWSNPPIRIGKRALHDLLMVWLGRLADGGEALLVVQKHLGADSLASWLTSENFDVNRLVSKSGFRLFNLSRAHPPRI